MAQRHTVRRTDDCGTPLPVTQGNVEAAYRAIRGHIRRTPVIEIATGDFEGTVPSGEPFTFKLEFLQHAGSFKTRGALNNLLTREGAGAGVVAASGGNHGAAVAFAARQVGVPAHIFVPSVASPAKMAQIESYGAKLVVAGDRYADALAESEAFLRQSNAIPVHAFDQDETLAGQGTVALEFGEQATVDTILVATGGGGLIGGMAAYLQGRIRLVGVEPEVAPTLHAALEAGEPVDAPAGGVAADSLAPRRIGEKVYPLVSAYVDRSVLVPDRAIVEAQQVLWRTLRAVTEPGGAAAFAALLTGAYRPEPDERVGVLLCGANSHAVRFDEAD
ncbi:MAG: threonine/serine dehydratase [Hyphomicrobiaceae bacterium]